MESGEFGELIRSSEFGIRNLSAGNDFPLTPRPSTINSPLSSLLSPHAIYESTIIKKNKLNDTVYGFAIDNKRLAKNALPGQFLHIKASSEHVLRRPISISNVLSDYVEFVIEARGDGTKRLCEKNVGESLDVIGPLGKGFSLPKGNVLLVGGGIGVAPLLFAAASHHSRAAAILGFRDKGKVILADSFSGVCDDVFVTTDDGSYGIHGTVAEPLATLLIKSEYSAVLTCGPHMMMASVAKLCWEHGMPCQVSLEERMACGVGACFVCACKTVKDGAEHMSRVCADGPVFDASEVVF